MAPRRPTPKPGPAKGGQPAKGGKPAKPGKPSPRAGNGGPAVGADVPQVGQPAPVAPQTPGVAQMPPPPAPRRPRVKQNTRAIARVRQAVREVIEETFGVGGYLGPSTPIAPRQPDGSEPRTWQYPPASNIQIQPKTGEGVSFPILRALAESSDYVRIAVNHRKDQIRGIGWSVTAINTEEAEAREDETEAVKEFFKKPDRKHDFSSWIDKVLEDVLVVDALTLFRQRTRGGDLYALKQVDGTTIKPLIDYDGDIPGPPLPAYQQFLYGRPDSQYTTDEMIYRPMRLRPNTVYGYSPVEAVLMKINMAMRRDIHTITYFTEGTMPEGFLNLPKEWSQNEIREFQDFFDNLMANVQAMRRRVFMVPGDSKFSQAKPFEFSREIDEWLAWIVAVAFGVSPMIFAKELPRANAEEEGNIQGDVGLQPMLLYLKGLLDEVIWNDLGFKDVHWNWTRDRSAKTEIQMKKYSTYVQDGTMSRDEVREREGLPARGGYAGELVAFSPRLGIVPLEAQTTEHEPGVDASEEPDEDLAAAPKPAVATKPQQPGSGGQPSPEISPRQRRGVAAPVLKAAKVSKAYAAYVPAAKYAGAERCRGCSMFEPEKVVKLADERMAGTCTRVRGSIEPEAHCRFWDKIADPK